MLSPCSFKSVSGTTRAAEFDHILSGGIPVAPLVLLHSLLMPVLYLFKNAFQYSQDGYGRHWL